MSLRLEWSRLEEFEQELRVNRRSIVGREPRKERYIIGRLGESGTGKSICRPYGLRDRCNENINPRKTNEGTVECFKVARLLCTNVFKFDFKLQLY